MSAPETPEPRASRVVPTADGDARTYQLIMDLRRAGVTDPRVLSAIEAVRREAFLDPLLAPMAYADRPIAIGHGERATPPATVALVLDAAELSADHKVLEVGTGPGYQAAVLARLVRRVYTIERHGELMETARARLAQAGVNTVACRCADGREGWLEQAPFDRIIINAALPERPERLLGELKPGGVLVAPIEDASASAGANQTLMRYRKTPQGVEAEALSACAFDRAGPRP